MEIIKVLKEVKPDVDFQKSSNFIEDGLLDSFDIITLVSEIEVRYDIEISGKDIIPENFVSVDSIDKMVRKYKNE